MKRHLNIFSKLTLLALVGVSTANAKDGANLPANLTNQVNTLAGKLSADLKVRAPVISSADQQFALEHVFVAYPGSPGLQTDVFTENFDSMVQDYGMPKSQMVFRDSRGAHARYGQTKEIKGFALPPGTAGYLDSEYITAPKMACGLPSSSPAFIAAQEANFLKQLYMEQQKPLVLMCHSAFCTKMLDGALAILHGNSNKNIVSHVFFIQGVNPPRNIMSQIGRINNGLEKAQLDANCAIENKLETNNVAELGRRVFFIADGGPRATNTYAPSDYGYYLGQLGWKHVDAVVAFGEGRSQRPLNFRRALMQTLVEIARLNPPK